jgi:hypothetical protein
MGEKIIRPRLTEWELKTFRRMVDDEYRQERRNLRWRRMRAEKGDRLEASHIPHSERYLKMLARLLRKLNRLLDGRYAINPKG